jgi:hypothetical protein
MKAKLLGKNALAIVLSGLLILASPGPGAYAAVKSALTQGVAEQAGLPILPAGIGITPQFQPAALTAGPFSLGLGAGSIAAPSAPSITTKGLAVVPTAALPIVTALPQAQPAEALQSPQAALKTGPFLPAGPQAKTESPARPLEELGANQEQVAKALSAKPSAEGASTAAELPFLGTRRSAENLDAVDIPAGTETSFRGTRLSPRSVRTKAALGAVAGIGALLGTQSVLHHAASARSFFDRGLGMLGAGGYWAANAIAFVFPIPQIHKTFREGGQSRTPVGRAIIGMTASLAIGLISAPLAGQLFWGLQNTFGALTLIAPVGIAKWMTYRGGAYSSQGALIATAAVSVALLAASAALYSAAAAFLPALLTAFLGKAGISALTLGVQVVTGIMFLMLFVPDIMDIMHKRTPKGFTSLVSLLFFAASTGFIFWAAQKAIAAPAGSAQRLQFIVYTVQNAIYAAVSFLSYLFRCKAEKKS